MIPLTVEQLADVVGGERSPAAQAEAAVTDVLIDSRSAGAGSLFVALPGEHTDGHHFCADAVRRGASACLVAADAPLDLDGLPTVVTDDPADALLGLGAWVRETADPAVIALTGSAGKTTTKDLVAAAVGAARSVVAAAGSFNNELGVPLTCCRLDLRTEVLVVEIGARGRGHIARLVPLVRPDVAIVTTISAAHLQQFSTVKQVAQAKGELVEGLDPGGVAILNADDDRVAALASRTDASVVTVGIADGADWQAVDLDLDELARVSFTVRGARVRLPLPGRHMVGNALAALAAADAVGVDLDLAAAALATARMSPWRMQVHRLADGVTVLNDAYNANPASTTAALRTLVGMRTGGRRLAVLGTMAELGDLAPSAHEDIGRLAADAGLARLVCVGEFGDRLAEGARQTGALGADAVVAVGDADEALAALDDLRGGDVLLVKASRSVGLERLADALVDRHGGDPDDAERPGGGAR